MVKKRKLSEVQWYLPNKNIAFIRSTTATKYLIDTLAMYCATIEDLYKLIKYDEEAKAILKVYLDNGYGQKNPKKCFSSR